MVIKRGEGKKPLVARFGGIELRRRKDAVINDRSPEVNDYYRSELVQRLLADQCELCGSEDDCEVHHINRLADIDRPRQKEKPSWVKRRPCPGRRRPDRSRRGDDR